MLAEPPKRSDRLVFSQASGAKWDVLGLLLVGPIQRWKVKVNMYMIHAMEITAPKVFFDLQTFLPNISSRPSFRPLFLSIGHDCFFCTNAEFAGFKIGTRSA